MATRKRNLVEAENRAVSAPVRDFTLEKPETKNHFGLNQGHFSSLHFSTDMNTQTKFHGHEYTKLTIFCSNSGVGVSIFVSFWCYWKADTKMDTPIRELERNMVNFLYSCPWNFFCVFVSMEFWTCKTKCECKFLAYVKGKLFVPGPKVDFCLWFFPGVFPYGGQLY